MTLYHTLGNNLFIQCWLLKRSTSNWSKLISGIIINQLHEFVFTVTASLG